MPKIKVASTLKNKTGKKPRIIISKNIKNKTVDSKSTSKKKPKIKISKSISNLSNSKLYYQPYPNSNSPNLTKNLAKRSEFEELKIEDDKRSITDICKPSRFNYRNYQSWIKRYLSIDSPYNGLLLIHEVGTGKTCTSLLFSESMKKYLLQFNNRIVYLTKSSLVDSVYGEIFSLKKFKKKRKKTDFTQCLGDTYQYSSEYHLSMDIEKQKSIKKKIKRTYKILGYEKYAREVMRTVKWKGTNETLTDEIKKRIENVYSSRVFIMDEVHNIKTSGDIDRKLVPPVIEALIRYTKNTKILMMSATPMYDNPREIIFYINLLRLNDGKPPMQESHYFDRENNLKQNLIDDFKEKIRGYISFVRGKKPPVFPFSIITPLASIVKMNISISGERIPEDKNINFVQTIPCYMSEKQYNYYNYSIKKTFKQINIKQLENAFENESNGRNSARTIRNSINNNDNHNNDNHNNNNTNDHNTNIINEDASFSDKATTGLSSVVQISNIALWDKNGKLLVGEKGFIGNNNDRTTAFYIHKIPGSKRVTFKIQNHLIHNIGKVDERPFLDHELMHEHSSKLYELYNNIKQSTGIIYIYSEYKYYGAIMIALFLEYMGFERYTTSGEYSLLDYPKNKSGGGGKRESLDYENLEPITKIKHRKPQFAKYILLSGAVKNHDIVRMTPKKAAEILNMDDNTNGQKVRIIIGTRISGEGLDLKRIRQIHILEPWYNLSRIEQIEGRGIRQCSHESLPESERNVEIFRYMSLPPIIKRNTLETIDYRIYRIAEIKDRAIKKVEKILKETSVDCYFWKKHNQFIADKSKSITLKLSSGTDITIPWGDQPFTRRCHYEESCEFKCDWEPDRYNSKLLGKNNSSYPANELIENIKIEIHKLFILDFQFSRDKIYDFVSQSYPEIDIMYVVLALDNLIQSKEIIYDMFDKECYLDYNPVQSYYYLLPIEMKNIPTHNIPRYYRNRPLTHKVKSISINEIDNKDIKKNSLSNVINVSNKNFFQNIEESIKNNILKINILLNKYNSIQLTNGEKILLAIGISVDYLSTQDTIKLINNIYINNGGKYGLTSYKNHFKNNNNYKFVSLNNINYWIVKLRSERNTYLLKWNGKKIEKITDKDKVKDLLKIGSKQGYDKKITKSPYHGFLSIEKGNPLFKIIILNKKTTLTLGSTESKRSTSTGRVCKTYKINDLETFFKKIEGKTYGKIKKDMLCFEIEFLLRCNQLKNKNNKTWFYYE